MDKKDHLEKLSVDLSVQIGEDEKSIEEILTWRKGTIVTLKNSSVNVVTLNVGNKLIGHGKILRNERSEMDLKVTEIFDK